jgi:integrase
VLIVGDTWKLQWPKEETKGKRHAHEVVLVGEELEIVHRAWANRLPDCDFLFHVDGKPLGPMRYELERTCAALGIPYGRGTGIVFHDTRHSAVTNLVDSGSGEAAAMSIPGHADPSVFNATTCAATPRRPRRLRAGPPTSPRNAARPRTCRRLARNDVPLGPHSGQQLDFGAPQHRAPRTSD